MSNPVYLQQGVTAHDSLVLQNPDGSFVTGKVQANFTFQLNNGVTGNQALTGITLTEVSSANNPGVYDLTFNGGTSFVGTIGSWTLKTYLTSAPAQFIFEQIYTVTIGGGAGPVTNISFTSTTNNGRAVDGSGNPLAGVIVYITKTNFFLAVTTNAAGNWGPVQLDASSTYALTYQLTGYSQASATLTTSTTTATGPGQDVSLTAIANGSTVLASTLWAHARRMSGNKTGAQADVKILNLCNDALDYVAQSHEWNWYKRKGWLSINAPFVTGTVTITNGTSIATFSSALPSWAAKGRLYINSFITDVASVTDTTHVVIASNWNFPTLTNSTFVMFQDTYTLPPNLFNFTTILEGQHWPYDPRPLPIEEIWRRQNWVTYGQTYANGFGIYNGNVVLYPYPSTSINAMYIYKARPMPLVNATDIADFPPSLTEMLYRWIEYYVAIYFGDCLAGSAEDCFNRAQEAMQIAQGNDMSTTKPASANTLSSRRAPMWLTRTNQ